MHPFLSIWSGLAATGHTFCSFSQNIEKPHQKFQKLSPTIFNLKTDFLISSCAFQCWNALSAVVEPRRPTGSELVVACYKRCWIPGMLEYQHVCRLLLVLRKRLLAVATTKNTEKTISELATVQSFPSWKTSMLSCLGYSLHF